MSLTPAEAEVLSRIDEDQLVRLTRDLIQAPGQNPPGEEAATVRVLAEAARSLGLTVTLTPVAPGRENLTITLAGGNNPGLLLLGHTDVVPIGEGWTVDPYGGLLRDDRLYGRGASDMKAGLAAALTTLATLRTTPLSGPLTLAAVIDEEETGKGIRAYLAALRQTPVDTTSPANPGPDSLEADPALHRTPADIASPTNPALDKLEAHPTHHQTPADIASPTNPALDRLEADPALHRTPVDSASPAGPGLDRLEAERTGAKPHTNPSPVPQYLGCITAEPTDMQTIIAARGDSYLRVEVHGRASHAGNPDGGANAIYGASAIIAEIERLHAELATAPHPLLGPATWSVGQINGGTGGSIVPAECVIVADRRLLPGESPAEVLAELGRRIAALRLEDRGLTVGLAMPMEMPAFETPADTDLVRTTEAARVDAGGTPRPLAGWTAACDGGYIARDLDVPVVVLGPGSVTTQAHRADESVPIAELLHAARTYTLTALRLLT
ncbi:M20/M25/M40 family metallo-hydrolase [Kribbella sp. NPDC026611]|uniref:M20/M25/M40 family metallo-hydrolase n=1 Tax=Kribbella sp. NPDC026611 TaxID=3154911 RepID=UPI0033CEB739